MSEFYGNPPPYQPIAPTKMDYQPVPTTLPPQYGSINPSSTQFTNVIINSPSSVVVVGGCPSCRVGVLEDDYTCLGVCCAIIFFPIGLLFCIALKQRHCPNCGAVFG